MLSYLFNTLDKYFQPLCINSIAFIEKTVEKWPYSKDNFLDEQCLLVFEAQYVYSVMS